jgi:hypothetical protein
MVYKLFNAEKKPYSRYFINGLKSKALVINLQGLLMEERKNKQLCYPTYINE